MYNFGSYYGHAPLYTGSIYTGGSCRPQSTLVPKYVSPTFNLGSYSYSSYKPYVPAVTAKTCSTVKTGCSGLSAC